MSAEVSNDWSVVAATAGRHDGDALRLSPSNTRENSPSKDVPTKPGELFGPSPTSDASHEHQQITNNCNGDDSDDSDISVGGCPSYTPPSRTPPSVGDNRYSPPSSPSCSHPLPRSPPPPQHSDDEYFKPLKKLRMMQLQKHELEKEQTQHSSSSSIHDTVAESSCSTNNNNNNNNVNNNNSVNVTDPTCRAPIAQSIGVKSFSIHDILAHEPPTPPTIALQHLQHLQQQQSVHIALATRRIVRPWDTDEDDEDPPDDEEDSMSVCSSSDASSVIGSPRGGSEGGVTPAPPGGRRKSGNPLDALFQMTSKTFNQLKNGTTAGQ